MKHIPRVLIPILALMSLGVSSGGAFAGGKIPICHVPPGNPSNAHTISIGESAWPAHENHGDTKGECGSGGDGENNSSVVAAAGAAFVICDEREGEIGRMVSVSAVGRLTNERLQCD